MTEEEALQRLSREEIAKQLTKKTYVFDANIETDVPVPSPKAKLPRLPLYDYAGIAMALTPGASVVMKNHMCAKKLRDEMKRLGKKATFFKSSSDPSLPVRVWCVG